MQKKDILKQASAKVKQTGKAVVVERQGEVAVAVLPWDTYCAFENWYEEQERERKWREQHEAFEREVAAFEQMKDTLLEKYRGRYVAIYQGEVVGTSSDKMELVHQMHERFGPVTMYVHQVVEQEPVYLMPSFQVVDFPE